MLNLTRRERNVIKTLVLLYIVGCIIFYGKEIFLKNDDTSDERDSIVADFQEKAEKVDSIYFADHGSLETDNIDSKKFNPVNINTATENELQNIRGIGPVTAKKIVEYRNSIGKFNSLEELKNVKGIGDKTLEKIKGEVTIE